MVTKFVEAAAQIALFLKSDYEDGFTETSAGQVSAMLESEPEIGPPGWSEDILDVLAKAGLVGPPRREPDETADDTYFRILPTILNFGPGWEPPSPEPQTDGKESFDPEAMMGCGDLANKFDVSRDALKKRLARFRREHDEGWIDNQTDRKNDPVHLYRVGAVIWLIREIRGERQTHG